MPSRVLLGLSKRSSVRRFLARNSLTKSVVDRFVAGDQIDDGIRAALELEKSGAAAILDYLGENVIEDTHADRAAGIYSEILDRVGRETPSTHISVKLTQLGLDLSFAGCLERIEKLCDKAEKLDTWVAIDMESHEYTDRTIATFRRLRESHSNVVLCLQAYLRRTTSDVASLMPLKPAIRLCKGAYDEPRETAYGRRETRQTFRDTLALLIRECPYTAVATHDDFLINETLRLSRRFRIPRQVFEFQMLYGVRRELQRTLAGRGFGVRIYVPFGEQWYPYLMRRLAERPANMRLFLEALMRG